MAIKPIHLRPHPPHVYQEYPRCFYGPGGQTEVFNSLDEVPEGWVTHPKMLEPDYEEPEEADAEEELDEELDEELEEEFEEGVTADELAGAYSQDALIDVINAANTGRKEADQIEFLGNWSKVRLAQALIDGGVEIALPVAGE